MREQVRAPPGPVRDRRRGRPPPIALHAPARCSTSSGSCTLVRASSGCGSASTKRAPCSASAARIRSARSGSSVPGVRTPTQISPPGSCRRCRSLHTTGIASPTARAYPASLSGRSARIRAATSSGLRLLAVERRRARRRAPSSDTAQRSISPSRCSRPDQPGGSRATIRSRSVSARASSRTSRWSSAPTRVEQARRGGRPTRPPRATSSSSWPPAVRLPRGAEQLGALLDRGERIRPRHLVHVDRGVGDLVVDERVAQRREAGRLPRPGGPVTTTANTRRVSHFVESRHGGREDACASTACASASSSRGRRTRSRTWRAWRSAT